MMEEPRDPQFELAVETMRPDEAEQPNGQPLPSQGNGVQPDSNRPTRWQETRLPVFGDVLLTEREFSVIDHPAFQRLFDFNQLGQVNLVYRGATHRRGEHAIGTVHVTQLIADRLARQTAEPNITNEWSSDGPLTATEVVIARLAALLHDIGHVPAGHTLEDELGLFAKHDTRARIRQIFDRPEWRGEAPSETLGQRIDRLFAVEAEASGLTDSQGRLLPATGIVELIVASDDDTPAKLDADFRLDVVRDIVGNTICADLLDYLHRDWLHLGKPRYFDQRIVDYFELLHRVNSVGEHERKLAINLRDRKRPRNDAVTLILDLLENRYQLNEIVLFHRAKLAAGSMLERALAELFEESTFDEDAFLERLLEWSDSELLEGARQLVIEGVKGKKGDARKRLLAASGLLRSLRVRHLHDQVTAIWADDVGGARKASIVELYQSGPATSDPIQRRENHRQAARSRLHMIRSLEADFTLPIGSLSMYCPPAKMNPKIAKVNVLFEGYLAPLDELEEKSNKAITGGHLDAQQDRFNHLWHVSLFAAEKTISDMDDRRLSELVRAFRAGLLGLPPHHGTIAAEMEDIARSVYGSPERSPNPSVEFTDSSVLAARSNPTGLAYLTGAPCLRSFLTER